MVTANVVGGPAVGFRDGRAETTAYVVPTGFSVTPPYGAAFAYAIDDLKHFVTDDGQVQADIPIILQSVNKQFVTRGVELQLSAKAFAASSLIDAGSVTAFFDSDFSQTLTWGGIARVTNPDTGEEITDWTVTSESGFDYSKPFAVPESSCLHLIATATVAGLALAVRHWMR